MIRKTTLFILSILLVNSVFCQNNLKELISKNEKAIFSIFTYDEFGVPSGSGTGFFISSSGEGITNYHVLNGTINAIIKTIDNKVFRIVEITEENPKADLVKFKIEKNDGLTLPYLSLKTTVLQKGENVFVIGNPHGFESTVSEGIVSSIREAEGYEQVIQITAPISPGSSGSPVMTLDGKVIGVATFQYKDGQNLNFAVTAKMIGKLMPKGQKFKKIENSNFIIINERCKENSELILNSIELKDNETILNFSFTNVSMGYGDFMLIWSKLNTKDETFFIQDLNTREKYFATGSTIGTSRENGTKITLGETKRFKLIFPRIPRTTSKISIMEGLSSSWNFINLDLSRYLNIESQETHDYGLQYALMQLETKDFHKAKLLLTERVESTKGDDDAYNILGIISYLLDNNYDAIRYFTFAIDANPSNDIYYFNRFRVYYEKKHDLDNSLSDISIAIKNRPNQGDYYQHRAYVFMAQKEWKKAVGDLDIALNQIGENWYLYKLRGNCKTWLQDFSGACQDWKYAYKLSNHSDNELGEAIRKYCK